MKPHQFKSYDQNIVIRIHPNAGEVDISNKNASLVGLDNRYDSLPNPSFSSFPQDKCIRLLVEKGADVEA